VRAEESKSARQRVRYEGDGGGGRIEDESAIL